MGMVTLMLFQADRWIGKFRDFFPSVQPKKPMRRNGGADVVLGDPDLKRSGLTVDDSQIVMFEV